MRGLSKQNLSKSNELCRFLKEPIDLDKKRQGVLDFKEEIPFEDLKLQNSMLALTSS